MSKNYMMINGKRINISEETAANLEKQFASKKDTGWLNDTNSKQNCFYIPQDGRINGATYYPIDEFHKLRHKRATYFSKPSKANEIDFKQTLWRRMQRWADEHNELWETGIEAVKFYLRHTLSEGWIVERYLSDSHVPFCIYFSSYQIAKKALDHFRDDLEKARTWND